MRQRGWTLWLGVVIWCAAALNAPGSTLDLTRNHAIVKGPLVRITVDDPVYKSKKRYEAIPLNKVVAQVPGFERARDSDAEVIFHCRDGYRPAMPLKVLLRSNGFLAVRDLDAGRLRWTPFKSAAGSVVPAPYYIVWKDLAPDDRMHPWPYQLERIEIVPPDEAFGNARPGPHAIAQRGFILFRDHCIKCHSINLAGGVMGSELNVPRSVVEYWNATDLRAFIRDPASVRARSRMPQLTSLSESEIAMIVTYLEEMSRRKICTSASGCREPVRTAQQGRGALP